MRPNIAILLLSSLGPTDVSDLQHPEFVLVDLRQLPPGRNGTVPVSVSSRVSAASSSARSPQCQPILLPYGYRGQNGRGLTLVLKLTGRVSRVG